MRVIVKCVSVGGNPTTVFSLVDGEEVLCLGSEAQFRSVTGTSYAELHYEMRGDVNKPYVRARLTKWLAMHVNQKQSNLINYFKTKIKNETCKHCI